jgi:hypothetical protein
MNGTSNGNAFRAQLVVPEHRQLFDYWLQCCAGRKMPTRNDIKPTQVPRLLSGISLIDVAADLGLSTIRLAGTRLREIHDREITGLTIESLDWGNKRDYWMTAYRRTIERCEPTQGVLQGPRLHKEHMVQYWLRLPVCREENGKVDIVLGHDYFLPASEEIEDARQIA